MNQQIQQQRSQVNTINIIQPQHLRTEHSPEIQQKQIEDIPDYSGSYAPAVYQTKGPKRKKKPTQIIIREEQKIEKIDYNGKPAMKKKISEEAYKNYEAIYKLGIGIETLEYKDGCCIMEEGLPLDQSNFEQIPVDAISQIKSLYESLKNNKLSHCDIKASNILICGDKIVLCDNDDLTKWGQKRRVCSEHQNISKNDYKKFMNKEAFYCDELTDKFGFDKVIEFLRMPKKLKEKLTKIIEKDMHKKFKPLIQIQEESDEESKQNPDPPIPIIDEETKSQNQKLYEYFIEYTAIIGIDIVLLVDLSFSMKPWIIQAKKCCQDILTFAQERYAMSQLRVAFIGFRDIKDQTPIVIQDFTKDIGEIKNLIEQQEALGGTKDDCANHLSALKEVLNLSFEQENLSFVVLITDSPCHGENYHSRFYVDKYRNQPHQVLQKLMQKIGTKSKRIKFAVVEINNSTRIMYNVMKDNFPNFEVFDKLNYKNFFGKNEENFLKSGMKDFLLATIALSVTVAATQKSKYQGDDDQNKFQQEERKGKKKVWGNRGKNKKGKDTQ